MSWAWLPDCLSIFLVNLLAAAILIAAPFVVLLYDPNSQGHWGRIRAFLSRTSGYQILAFIPFLGKRHTLEEQVLFLYLVVLPVGAALCLTLSALHYIFLDGYVVVPLSQLPTRAAYIVPHGLFELSALITAAFTPSWVYRQSERARGESFQMLRKAIFSRKTVIRLILIVFLLGLAAVIEETLTPAIGTFIGHYDHHPLKSYH